MLNDNNSFPKFTGTTSGGSTFTEKVFLDYDACVVCFWNPSKEDVNSAKQMNYYYEELKKENIGFIGILIDGSSDEEVEYPNITLENTDQWLSQNGISKEKITNYVVSHEGKIIGKAIEGNLYLNSSKTDEYLQKALGKNISACAQANLLVKENVSLTEVANKVSGKTTQVSQQETIKEANKEELNVENLKSRFLDANVVVMGDSLATGLEDYDILDAQSVIANRGAGMATIDNHIETASNLLPQVVVLEYGLNDIEYYNGNADKFINLYTEKIDKIREELPNAVIYVCKIIPVKESVTKERELFTHIDEYNQAIEKMCSEKNISCLDTGSLIEDYSGDGIHPKYSYYKYWAAYIAEVVGI
jgi:hypothetical protein